MTLGNIVENVMLAFPRATEAQIIKEVDVAQRKFVARTRLLKEVGELSGIDSYISFSLPNNFKSLISINYYDSNDAPIYEEELDIAAEIHTVSGSKKITFRSTTLTPISEIPSSIDSIQLEYYKYPDAITTTSSSLSIAEEYWEALENMVMIKLYKIYPQTVVSEKGSYSMIDWRAIAFLQKQVEAYERKAEIERNVGSDDRPYDIQIYTHAGEQYISKRTKITATTITIEGSEVAYTKFFRAIAVDDDSYEVQEASGWTVDPTIAVVSGTPAITITSAGNEFTVDPATWVYNNQNAGYSWDNAGQITIRPDSTSFGTMEIVVYIY